MCFNCQNLLIHVYIAYFIFIHGYQIKIMEVGKIKNKNTVNKIITVLHIAMQNPRPELENGNDYSKKYPSNHKLNLDIQTVENLNKNQLIGAD